MTLVATAVPDNVGGIHAEPGYFDVFIDIAITGSYVTGGDTLDLRPLAKRGGGRGSILFCLFESPVGFEVNYDRTNQKLLFWTSGNTQLAAAAYPAGLLSTSFRGLIKTL